ncbi:MAG: hypothetical protein WC421_01975 [Elusimicrobiales bacterium]
MKDTLDIVLLLALPASGKSEVRRYLEFQTPQTCRDSFHMGPTVQLDDFPYVHIMRRADDEAAALGKPRMFFSAPDKPFADPRDWGTLIELINEDYADLAAQKSYPAGDAAARTLARIERAAGKCGISGRFSRLDAAAQSKICAALEAESAKLIREKTAAYAPLEGKTVVIEFARGGAQGSPMPLKSPFGYRHSLALLSDEILKKAVILYIWVTPEESRRKNAARANPDDPGSILHHGVPEAVMLGDYGCDDMDWLEQHSPRPGAISVETRSRTFYLPIGRFDNRVDKTSFLRADPKQWNGAATEAVRSGIKSAMDKVFSGAAEKVSR